MASEPQVVCPVAAALFVVSGRQCDARLQGEAERPVFVEAPFCIERGIEFSDRP